MLEPYLCTSTDTALQQAAQPSTATESSQELSLYLTGVALGKRMPVRLDIGCAGRRHHAARWKSMAFDKSCWLDGNHGRSAPPWIVLWADPSTLRPRRTDLRRVHLLAWITNSPA